MASITLCETQHSTALDGCATRRLIDFEMGTSKSAQSLLEQQVPWLAELIDRECETLVIDFSILFKVVRVVTIGKDSTNKKPDQACRCIESGA